MQFPHRHNTDGSFDSICPRCVITIATAMDESDLSHSEAIHECDPVLVAYYGRMCRQPERREERKGVRSKVEPVQDLAQVLTRIWNQVREFSDPAGHGNNGNSGKSSR